MSGPHVGIGIQKTREQEWTEPVPAHPYAKLRKLNVNERIEKKGGLSYLSWAFAVDTLLTEDPSANWEYPIPVMYGETMMVFCAVTAFGKAMEAHLPVMNHMNKAVANPNAFEVNTAMQRCLVKAIALHGIALYIYAGEDLPAGSDAKGDIGSGVDPKAAQRLAEEFKTALSLDTDESEVSEAVFAVHLRAATDSDLYTAASEQLSASQRAQIKACVALVKADRVRRPPDAQGPMRIVLAKGVRTSAVERIGKVLSALPAEKAWRIEVSEHKPTRSNDQNRFLWAIYDQILREGGEEMGGWTKEDLHEFFLLTHFGSETRELFGRKRLIPLRRSRKLNKQEFTDMIDTIQRFMAERGVYIQDPEQL